MHRIFSGAASLAIVVAALTIGLATPAAAQDILYAKRFNQELMRKIPPVYLAAPTAEELAHSDAVQGSAIPLPEAEALMGLNTLNRDSAGAPAGRKAGHRRSRFRRPEGVAGKASGGSEAHHLYQPRDQQARSDDLRPAGGGSRLLGLSGRPRGAARCAD